MEEAQALLPELRERLDRVRSARRAVIDGTRRVDERVRESPGGAADTEAFAASRELRTQVEALNELGIVLRDSESGLVDFPTRRDGEAAFLCWRSGEPSIAFWHPEDSGFSGRRPL